MGFYATVEAPPPRTRRSPVCSRQGSICRNDPVNNFDPLGNIVRVLAYTDIPGPGFITAHDLDSSDSMERRNKKTARPDRVPRLTWSPISSIQLTK